MANLTITVDEEVLRRARIRALELNTSVNAVLREYLDEFIGEARNIRSEYQAMKRRVSYLEGKVAGLASTKGCVP